MKNLTNSFLLSAGLLLCGCGQQVPSYDLNPVGGTVTLDGKPVAGALVTFSSDSGARVYGETDAAGQYQLKTIGHGDGAPADKYHVRVENGPESAGSAKVPVAYGETGVTYVTVEKEGTNTFDLPLKSKPTKTDLAAVAKASPEQP